MPAKLAAQLPYTLRLPHRQSTSAVFASPHSGDFYPADFVAQAVLPLDVLRSSEDAFVDRFLAVEGAPVLTARYPRAFVDLNRSADDLDPAVIAGAVGRANARIAAGLGVIPRVVSGGRAIYRGKLSQAEAAGRLATVWHPYHACLRALLDETRAAFGEAILFDFHSMPSEAIEITGPLRPEIVIGDRYGASASARVIGAALAAFEAEGFRVARNAPFAGAYIAQTYGQPDQGVHVLQIEIDRALYMDQRTIRPLPEFDAFAQRIAAVIAGLADIGRKPARLAAE
ncbi:N-formylglutamate amidohydrolase [Thioclava sp. A2]|uniref:N-formylglutamate amidohydrolase n=1 Tax=Thioclava sp. FCG-A2 TaxID=3080562 RepID=UPI002955CE6D|nr:N-formylglutamate amidohydrolase [Thioclava sp. A2]